MHPLIEPGMSNLQDPAQRGDRVLMTVLVDKAVFHSGSLAKYRAAFLICRALVPAVAFGHAVQNFAFGFE